MKIKDIFKKDIKRSINAVVKVDDIKDDTLQQELEEYIVTKELKPHFHKFFSNFSESFDSHNDKIGVWISGFYGSGKSHFLKILSYLLENKEVNGKSTVEYFRDKFDDPMEFDMIERCCSKGYNKTILFNVDNLTGDKTKTAIKDVFAQVFYDSIGYFGRDIKVVRFEQNLNKLGKLQEFKNKYLELAGDDWENTRDAFDFYADSIIDALVQANIMSEESAKNLVYTKDTSIFSIDTLAEDIKEYVDAKGKDFRLIFMVDEIAQYIGEDLNLMLNLQTLVEELGTKCKGKVWVIVTGQEAIDQIIKVNSDQLSKIMGRFDTKLHLTASSVDEVVKKRLLAKNENGIDQLKLTFESKSAVLKNTFTFEQATADLKGYVSQDEFVDVYPFIPYQFRLFRDVMNGLRDHDQVNEQTAGNARSMVGACHSGLTETKNHYNSSFADSDIEYNGSPRLFSFDVFFDTISEKLNFQPRETIQRATDAAENSDGLVDFDVRVLKLLYLLRYADKDIKATVNNIAILITDSIDEDQIRLRKQIQESLERLIMQNYVLKNGEIYTFLSNEEKEIETEIKATVVTQDELSKKLGEIIFSDIYPLKKAKYNDYDFEFGRYVDDLPIGSDFECMRFEIITPGNPFGDANEESLILNSTRGNKVICVIPNQNGFYEKMRDFAKIEKYNKTKNQTSLPQTVKDAILARVRQSKNDERGIRDNIDVAIRNATFYIAGDKVDIKGSTAKEKISNALTELIVNTYTKLDKITYNIKDQNEIKNILNFDETSSICGRIVTNTDAVADLEQFLNLKYGKSENVTVADIYKKYQGIPYGYRGYDIAGMIAELMVNQKVVLSYAGIEYKKSDSIVMKLLFEKNYIDSTIVKQRIAVDPALLSKCINIMKDFIGEESVPTREDDFLEYVENKLKQKATECDEFIKNYYNSGKYPQKLSVEKARDVYNSILLYKSNSSKFLNIIKDKQNELLEVQEDIADVINFFKGSQKTIFDKALKKCEFYNNDVSYIKENVIANDAFEQIKAILSMDRPFNKISSLNGLLKTLEEEHDKLLIAQKNTSLKKIDSIKNELYSYVKEYNKSIYTGYVNSLTIEADFINDAVSIIAVVAEDSKINNIKEKAVSELLAVKPTVQEGESITLATIEPKDVDKNDLFESTTLKTKGEVDAYIEKLKSKLYKYIFNGGIKIN